MPRPHETHETIYVHSTEQSPAISDLSLQKTSGTEIT